MNTPQRNLVDAHPNDLRRMLDHTLQFGTTADLEALFDDGMDVNQDDFEKRTALMMSSFRGKKDAVEMLIRRGADVNRVFMYHDRIPQTALDAARESGKTAIVEILLAHGAKTGKELNPSQ